MEVPTWSIKKKKLIGIEAAAAAIQVVLEAVESEAENLHTQ